MVMILPSVFWILFSSTFMVGGYLNEKRRCGSMYIFQVEVSMRAEGPPSSETSEGRVEAELL